MLRTMQSTPSTLLHALLFGFCGLLGLLALNPLNPFLFHLYPGIFMVYSLTFFLITRLSARISRQVTPHALALQHHTITTHLWVFWVFMTSLWLIILSVFIIYPALVSGVYRFAQESIWSMSFPNMPRYMRTGNAGFIVLIILIFGYFIYYPFTFYLLITQMRSHNREIWRLVLFTGMSLTPIILHHLIYSMFTWLVD